MIFGKQIEKVYRAQLFTRCDDTESVFYFSPTDFPSLVAKPYTFLSSKGHTLQGYFYHYADPIGGKLIVFDHGFGGGHRAYMREIELLCQKGYLVFSYDHTGCMESGGESTSGFAQSLCDLDDCLSALAEAPEATGRTISVIGHSWGGYSTLNIPTLHPEVTHIVVLAGPVSARALISQNFHGLLRPFRKQIFDLELTANPTHAPLDGITALRGSKTKALLIYCADDPIVKKAYHFDILQNALAGEENVSLVLTHGKAHNPNYTADAVSYLGAFFAARTAKQKAGELATADEKRAFLSQYDWYRMTAQDDGIWQTILAHLEK